MAPMGDVQPFGGSHGGLLSNRLQSGYEFCYSCGAEWENRKPTCSFPILDERDLIREILGFFYGSGASTLDDHIRTPSHLKSSSDYQHVHMHVSSFEAFKLLKVNPGIFARHILSSDALAWIQAKYPGHDH